VPRNTIAMARDPQNSLIYLANANGDLSRLNPAAASPALEKLYAAADHRVGNVAGFAIGPDGTFYLSNNTSQGSRTVAAITKGVLDPATGARQWSILASTEPYPLSGNNFDHRANGMVISPDNRYIFLNSGSRTDHGEVQANGGIFPGVREVPLSASIFRLPTGGQNLVIPAEEEALRASGYLFAKGVRNAYDLAFAPNGDLFATENGPDRDMDEELNWLREGRHYGFPWRMGREDNPQQFPDYEPAKDELLPPNFVAIQRGTYVNDPTFPPPPAPFTDPVLNLGPDADSFRDSADGEVKDASDQGLHRSTFTAHRSPLGLVFDVEKRLAGPYTGNAFMLSWTEGDAFGDSKAGPFRDPGQDLLHLELRKKGEEYEARVTRIADRFANPIDAVLLGNRLYVLEYSGNRAVWEITFPESPTAVAELGPIPARFSLDQNYPNPFNAGTVIRFELEKEGAVELGVFSLQGQRVRTLVSGVQAPGSRQVVWDGRDERGQPAASGVYLYRLRAGGMVQTRRLILLK
jgi:glucose/arabinose dehydrogenase